MYNIEDIFELFDRVQREEIFSDQKKMADAIPLFEIKEINKKYHEEKRHGGFNLKQFVLENFKFPKDEVVIPDVNEQLSIEKHIDNLWQKLVRYVPVSEGNLIALPYPYIVPGGRFLEFFYWDSYFSLLGLQESKKFDLIEGIIENFAFLIRKYGFIPNANRSYFLSRSQPPYFSLMIELLAEIKGENIYKKYLNELLREYFFWMKGSNALASANTAIERVVMMEDGEILNRYYDGLNLPRYESYMNDIKEKERSENENFFLDIRSACESGWDFSSRWFKKYDDISSIETQNIVPIDLNCLLWKLEKTIAKCYEIMNSHEDKEEFLTKAEMRKNAIQKYFWSEKEGFYFDFHLKNNEVKKTFHIASVYPLYLNISDENQAIKVSEIIQLKFLKKGGIVTSLSHSGQQWDAPNGWAPNQWITFIGIKNYGQEKLAESIRNNWCQNVENVYKNTGKLMEKYNVENVDLIARGGEYSNQHGFGWTNGVYLKLKYYYKKNDE